MLIHCWVRHFKCTRVKKKKHPHASHWEILSCSWPGDKSLSINQGICYLNGWTLGFTPGGTFLFSCTCTQAYLSYFEEIIHPPSNFPTASLMLSCWAMLLLWGLRYWPSRWNIYGKRDSDSVNSTKSCRFWQAHQKQGNKCKHEMEVCPRLQYFRSWIFLYAGTDCTT